MFDYGLETSDAEFGALDPATGMADKDAANYYIDPEPIPPWIRGRSEREAVVDVARVTAKAAADDARFQDVADKWGEKVGALGNFLATAITTGPLSYVNPAALAYKMATRLTKPGDVVVSESAQKHIADKMAAIYKEGANDLRSAAPDMDYNYWAELLHASEEHADVVKEAAEEASLASAARDAADRAERGFKIGAPIVALAALGFGLLYMQGFMPRRR